MPAVLIALAGWSLVGCGAVSEGEGSVAVMPGGDSGDGHATSDGAPTTDGALPDAARTDAARETATTDVAPAQDVVGNCGVASGEGCAAFIDDSAPGCGSNVFVGGETNVLDIAVAGQRVLWVTEQGLLRARDIAGGPVATLATFDASWSILLVDQESAYYGTTTGIQKLSLAGGVPTLLAAAGVTAMALSATSLYFAEDDPIANGGNRPTTAVIRRVPLSGGSVEDVTATDATVTSLVVDDAFVYWTTATQTSNSIDKYGSVLRAPLNGGTHEVLASNQASPQGIALDASSVYWCSGGTFGVDNSMGDGAVRSVAKSGGSITELACGLNNPARLVVTGGYVYWITIGAGSVTAGKVGAVPLAGSPAVVLGSTSALPTMVHPGLAASDSDMYWGSIYDEAIFRAPLR